MKIIPVAIKRAIDLHAKKGCPCGQFVTAVLENNLREAINRADKNSLDALVEIVQYCHWEIPGNSWGSKEKVTAWIELGGDEGKKAKKASDSQAENNSAVDQRKPVW